MANTNASARAVSLSKLAAMGVDERTATLRALVRETAKPPNGELTELDAKIRSYETRLGADAETLRRDVTEGRRSETAELCDLLMLMSIRNRLLASHTARSR